MPQQQLLVISPLWSSHSLPKTAVGPECGAARSGPSSLQSEWSWVSGEAGLSAAPFSQVSDSVRNPAGPNLLGPHLMENKLAEAPTTHCGGPLRELRRDILHSPDVPYAIPAPSRNRDHLPPNPHSRNKLLCLRLLPHLPLPSHLQALYY